MDAEPGIAIGLLGELMLGRMVAGTLERQPPEALWATELRELARSLDLLIATWSAASPRAASRPR